MKEPVVMSLSAMKKYPRNNKLLIVLAISLPLYLNGNNFRITISGVDPSEYSIGVEEQDSAHLDEVQCTIDYRTNIAGKSIELAYSDQVARRLTAGERRMLLSTSFELTLTVDAFPPANYIPEDTLSFF